MGNVKAIFQKCIAILIVLVIFLGQYAITGFLATSYAIDLLTTQSSNVQFRAYFKNGEEELTEVENSINNKDLKLKIDVAVNNEGYFNGKIVLDNAGFKFGQAVENNYIKQINNNEITLNQINAGETASIEVEIEYFEDTKINAQTLNQTTTVKLQGEYVASSGSNISNVHIDSGSDVKVTWKIPENTKAELNAKVQTNSTYQVNDQNKKIVQFLTSSKLTNNAYPVKNTQITATIPTGATNVEVHKRTIKATNGEQEFTTANYSVENDVLTININNTEEDGKISWMKGVYDIFVVTYEYPENTDLSAQTITINEKITAQNNVELNAEQIQLTLNEEKDGIASISKQEGENSIYKGKIYSEEGRDITSYSFVYVEYVDGVKDIEIKEEQAKFIKQTEENGETTTQENDANVEIKSVKINKGNISSVLGNTWNLTIGEITITNDTETDENGDISIALNSGIKTLTIKTSKPVNNGSFIIETTKRIFGTDYTRAQLKEFTKLKDGVSIKYTKNNDNTFTFTSWNNLKLKETEAKASLQSEQTALIAGSDSQALNLTAVLESSGDHQDLYKNPEIKIKLPSQIKNVVFTQKPQLMYANGLELTNENYKIAEENGQKVLSIKLTGEQTSYLGEAVKGTTILISTNVEIDANTTNSDEEIVMTYTNENATKYTDNGTQKVNIQIVQAQGGSQNETGGQGSGNDNQDENTENGSQNIVSKNTNLGLKVDLKAEIGKDTIVDGGIVRAGEIITYTAKITNTGSSTKDGVSIQAIIPNKATLIEINPKYPKERFYTEEEIEDPNTEINTNYFVEKTNNISLNSISIEGGKTKTLKYMVRVNTDIEQDTNIENTIKLSDGSNEDEVKFNSVAKKSKIIAELIPIARTGTEELKSGYGAIYKLIVKNISNVEQQNVRITLNKNELIELVNIYCSVDDDFKAINTENSSFVIDSISPNGIAYIEIDTEIKQYTENLSKAEMYATITDSENNILRTNILSEQVEGVKINATINSQTTSNEADRYVKNGDTIIYQIKLKNIGDIDTKELKIKDMISPYIDIESITINGNECEYIKGTEQEDEIVYDIYTIDSSLKAGQEITIEVKGKVKSNIVEEGKLSIINKAVVYDVVKITETQEEKYYLENYSASNQNESGNGDSGNTSNESGNGDNGNTSNESGNGDSGNSSNENGTGNNENIQNNSNGENKEEINSNGYSINGIVWVDNDKDGKREQDELPLQGIKVYAVNIETDKIEATEQTDSNGKYSLQGLKEGQYMVAFEYNTDKYNVTIFNATGVAENQNSDAVKVNKIIENEEKTVAITDILNINKNQYNIDLGLIEETKGNVKIEKTISNIIITNKNENKKTNFKDTQLAKIEIDSKKLTGSNVLIEYKIKLTNVGSSDVYIKNIIDYLPNSLEFNSSLNKNWYKKDGYLVNPIFNKEKISAGETKEVKLILIKKMTENNTGLVNNKAKIEAIYNADGTADNSDITSSADVIISIKTGEEITFSLFVILATLITLGIAYMVKRIIGNRVYKN